MGHIFLDTDYGVDTIFHGLPPTPESVHIYITADSLFGPPLVDI